MAFKTMEDVLQGVLDHAGNVLEQFVVQIESARGVTIPRGWEMDRYDIVDFHRFTIEILADETEPSGGEDETQPMIGDYWNLHRVNIYITYSGTKPRDITDTIMRMLEAFQLMVRDDESFGDRFNLVKLLRVDYTPLAELDKKTKSAERQFAKIGTVFLQVRD